MKSECREVVFDEFASEYNERTWRLMVAFQLMSIYLFKSRAVIPAEQVVVPQYYEVAFHGTAAAEQTVDQLVAVGNVELQIVEEAAVHHDERMFDDVGGLVVVQVVKRVGVAGAAAEARLFGIS